MGRVYLINNTVEFHVDHHILISRKKISESVILNTPASRCLLLLIQRQYSVISQDIFFNEVWSRYGAHVSANTFYQNISLLRRGLAKVGLGDEIVKTVPRKGLTLTDSTHVLVLSDEKLATQETDSTLSMGLAPLERLSMLAVGFKNKLPSGRGACYRWSFKNKTQLFSLSAVIFLLVVTFFLLFSITSQKSYFSHYQLEKIVDRCIFLTEKSFSEQDRLFDFLSENKIDCNAPYYKYYYLTSYRFTDRISLVKCSDDLNKSASASCVSLYFLKKREY
ncbi:winged helix-turn-helix domain-containing protein [Erwinia typographi]|nr:winged helix-turn-helix domain-containing protein [Erwinia typographi]